MKHQKITGKYFMFLMGLLFNEQINLPSEQICIPFGNVWVALSLFNTVCMLLEALKFGTTSCLLLYVWHYAEGINVIKRYQSQINFPLISELSRMHVLSPDKLCWDKVTLFSWVNWTHNDTGWWSDATLNRSSCDWWVPVWPLPPCTSDE